MVRHALCAAASLGASTSAIAPAKTKRRKVLVMMAIGCWLLAISYGLTGSTKVLRPGESYKRSKRTKGFDTLPVRGCATKGQSSPQLRSLQPNGCSLPAIQFSFPSISPPAACHALHPPAIDLTFLYPISLTAFAARADRYPPPQ